MVNERSGGQAPPAAGATPPAAADREALFWSSVKDGTDPAGFEAYLKQYPDGTFAPLARQRLASVSEQIRALSPARFDGVWNVTVQCPAHEGASGYTLRFPAQVKDAVLSGQFGTPGQPGSLTLTGKIEPDGNASIDARGMTGDPRYAANQLNRGSAYAYRAGARRRDLGDGVDPTISRPRKQHLPNP